MKKILFSILIATLFLFANARAQSSAQVTKSRLVMGFDLGLPIGASFIFSPDLGVEIPESRTGSLDLGARYESWTKNTGILSFIGIRAGYNF